MIKTLLTIIMMLLIPTTAFAEMPKSSDDFVNSIGVNTHLGYTDSVYYQQWTTMKMRLEATGIRHVRDGLYNNPASWYIQRLYTLGSAGIYSDLITSVGQTSQTLTSYSTMLGPKMESFEAPNEYDLKGGTNWAANLDAWLPTLYSVGHPLLPVVGPSLTSDSAYLAIGNISSEVDYGNNHNYFANHNPGTSGWGGTHACGVYATIAFDMCIARTATFGDPLMVTETGYQDDLPSGIKLRYTLRSLLEFWNAGYSKMYLYQFADDASGQTYGMIDSTGNPKPLYWGVQSLIALLTDPGQSTTLNDLAWSMAATSSVHHTLLQRHDGSYRLVLWEESSGWNTTTKTPITVAPQTVTVTLPAGYNLQNAVTILDSGSTSPVTITSVGGNSWSLSVGDSPTVLAISL